MKQEILRLRDSGLVSDPPCRTEAADGDVAAGREFRAGGIKTVVGLLAGPGMIQRADFGGFILLRPEVLSRYAAAVVRKVRKHPQEFGCIRERRIARRRSGLPGFQTPAAEDEAVLLRTLLETFVSRAWCLRQPCDGSAMLRPSPATSAANVRSSSTTRACW